MLLLKQWSFLKINTEDSQDIFLTKPVRQNCILFLFLFAKPPRVDMLFTNTLKTDQNIKYETNNMNNMRIQYFIRSEVHKNNINETCTQCDVNIIRKQHSWFKSKRNKKILIRLHFSNLITIHILYNESSKSWNHLPWIQH